MRLVSAHWWRRTNRWPSIWSKRARRTVRFVPCAPRCVCALALRHAGPPTQTAAALESTQQQLSAALRAKQDLAEQLRDVQSLVRSMCTSDSLTGAARVQLDTKTRALAETAVALAQAEREYALHRVDCPLAYGSRQGGGSLVAVPPAERQLSNGGHYAPSRAFDHSRLNALLERFVDADQRWQAARLALAHGADEDAADLAERERARDEAAAALQQLIVAAQPPPPLQPEASPTAEHRAERARVAEQTLRVEIPAPPVFAFAESERDGHNVGGDEEAAHVLYSGGSGAGGGDDNEAQARDDQQRFELLHGGVDVRHAPAPHAAVVLTEDAIPALARTRRWARKSVPAPRCAPLPRSAALTQLGALRSSSVSTSRPCCFRSVCARWSAPWSSTWPTSARWSPATAC
jgi:hypothetical protein